MHSTSNRTLDTLLSNRAICIASLLLSLWLIAIDPVINTDAIIYLRTADAFLREGFVASFALFDRPLLPIAMAIIHKFSGLSLEYSGQLLISLIYMLLCLSFVTVIKQLGGNQRVQLFALLLILCHPIINNYRSSIMRDPGFWAFSLLSLMELLRYAHQQKFKHQLRWLIYTTVAILFRFEAVLFLTLAPFGLLLSMHQRISFRLKTIASLLLPAFILLILSLGVLMLWFDLSLGKLFPHIALYADKLIEFQQHLAEVSITTAEALLRHSAQEDAAYAVIFGLIGIFILNLLRALMLPFAMLVVAGWWTSILTPIKRSDNRLILTYIAISVAYLLTFTLANRFMLERYCTLLVILLLIYVPFILDHFWQHTGTNKKTLIRGLIAGLLAIIAIDSIHNTDYKKAYIVTASSWVQNNTPENATVLANDKHLAYFSKRKVDWAIRQNQSLEKILSSGVWRQNQYLLIKTKKKNYKDIAELLPYPQLKLERFISGKDRGGVVVLRNSIY